MLKINASLLPKNISALVTKSIEKHTTSNVTFNVKIHAATTHVICDSCGNKVSLKEEACACGNICNKNIVDSSTDMYDLSNSHNAFSNKYMEGTEQSVQTTMSGIGAKKNSLVQHNSKNYEENTRAKYISYIKKQLEPHKCINKAILDQTITQFLEFKSAGNTNRAEINKGIIAALLKKIALEHGLELSNKKLGKIFGLNVKHVTRGIQIIIDSNIPINFDINQLILNYIESHFDTLRIPRKWLPLAQSTALFVYQHVTDISGKFIPHSIAAWVSFYIILICEVDFGITYDKTKKKNLYASKVKALFDRQQVSACDEPGSTKDHIVSNVNITKVDREMESYKPKLNRIMYMILNHPTYGFPMDDDVIRIKEKLNL